MLLWVCPDSSPPRGPHVCAGDVLPPEGEAEGTEQGESIEAMSSWRSRALGGQVSPADSLGSLGAVSEHAPAVGQGTQGTQALAALTRQHQTWLGANRT